MCSEAPPIWGGSCAREAPPVPKLYRSVRWSAQAASSVGGASGREELTSYVNGYWCGSVRHAIGTMLRPVIPR